MPFTFAILFGGISEITARALLVSEKQKTRMPDRPEGSEVAALGFVSNFGINRLLVARAGNTITERNFRRCT